MDPAASTTSRSAAVAAVAVATTGQDRLKPGAPVSNIRSEPMTKAAMPPVPSTAEGAKASPTMSAMPSATSPAPA